MSMASEVPSLRPLRLSNLVSCRKLSMGCHWLDNVFNGGLPCGFITEFVGESTAAKTQLCLQLLLQVQLPMEQGGLGGSAVYFYTEGEPPIKRLQEMASLLQHRFPAEALSEVPDPLANIYIERGFDDTQDLLTRLHRLRRLLQAPSGRPVRLIVVDSIAAVARDLGDKPGVAELAARAEMLFRTAAMLRRYAADFGLAVVVTNQVMDAVGADESLRVGPLLPVGTVPKKALGHTGPTRLVSAGREVIPALGLAWANCITQRVFLGLHTYGGGSAPAYYEGPASEAQQKAAAAAPSAQDAQDDGTVRSALRHMYVVWAPHTAAHECFFIVERAGVRGLAPAELERTLPPGAYNPYMQVQCSYNEYFGRRSRRATQPGQQGPGQQAGQQQGAGQQVGQQARQPQVQQQARAAGAPQQGAPQQGNGAAQTSVSAQGQACQQSQSQRDSSSLEEQQPACGAAPAYSGIAGQHAQQAGYAGAPPYHGAAGQQQQEMSLNALTMHSHANAAQHAQHAGYAAAPSHPEATWQQHQQQLQQAQLGVPPYSGAAAQQQQQSRPPYTVAASPSGSLEKWQQPSQQLAYGAVSSCAGTAGQQPQHSYSATAGQQQEQQQRSYGSLPLASRPANSNSIAAGQWQAQPSMHASGASGRAGQHGQQLAAERLVSSGNPAGQLQLQQSSYLAAASHAAAAVDW